MSLGLNAFLILSGLLFSIGFFGVLLRRNTLVLLMSLEIMFNGINVALVAFSRFNRVMDGSLLVFFIIAVAAAEVAIGLALLVRLYKVYGSVRVNTFCRLKS